MVSYHDLAAGFRKLGISPFQPVIVHASLSAFGEIRGGAHTFLGALIANYERIMMPAFTFKTMIIPEIGPALNGIDYGSGKDLNRMAEFFYKNMPVDNLMGDLAETLRCHPAAQRSTHPILSFSGINVDQALRRQTLEEPFAPIQALSQEEGWVILAGVDNSVNTSIHLGEALAGRKTFTRWGLTELGVVVCPHYPGCSDGFVKIEQKLTPFTRITNIGETKISAMPIESLLDTVQTFINKNPKALLCSRKKCPRCDDVRKSLKLAKKIVAS